MRLVMAAGTAIVAVCFVLSAVYASATAPNAAVGAQISAQCQACHGANGVSIDSSIPNLAGQKYVYLVQQMDAFKSRSRVSGLMNEYSATLTEEQIQDICAFYAAIPFQVVDRPKAKH
jgi:cytochrome c553